MPTSAHGEYECELYRPPWRVCRHHEPHAGRNYPEAGQVHATHAHIDREPQQVTPRIASMSVALSSDKQVPGVLIACLLIPSFVRFAIDEGVR